MSVATIDELSSSSLEKIEAIDGAGPYRRFVSIIFPLLSPTTFFLTLLGIIGTFKAFNHIYVLRDPSVDIAVMETARGGLIRNGMGYRRCNVAACLNIFSSLY